MVVTSVSSHIRDLAYLREHILSDEFCTVMDVTSGTPMLGIMGPKSRALLTELTGGTDFGNDAFPFGTSQELEIGYAIVRANRITYVGELGWEIYIPAEFALHVFDSVIEVGAKHGLKLAGFHAMNACRTEKGYRHWGHDIGIEDTPLEGGLGFTCAFDKPGGFIGREAVLQQKELGAPSKRLLQFKLADQNEMLYHEEPIFADGKAVGVITSGMYGHRLDASLGMGYVKMPHAITTDWVSSAKFEIGIGERRVAAQAQLGPWYDPKGEKIKN